MTPASAISIIPEWRDPGLEDGRAILFKGLSKGFIPRPDLNVWQWADRYRRLEGASESGIWRTSRNPPAKSIMESLSPDCAATKITVCAGTQTVKTETANNFIGFAIHQAPGPIVVSQPTRDLCSTWKLTKFDVMAEATPVLHEIVNARRGARRSAGNSLRRVRFPGGWLHIVTASSAKSLAMINARYLLIDEVDSYEEEAGSEGAVLPTLWRRTDTYGDRKKILQISSPKKLMGSSLIWSEYLAGDQRSCYVPCTHCNVMQILLLEQITHTGEYLCEHCGTAIPHSAKTEMLANHEWRSKYPERIYHHSYYLPSWYSSPGLGRTWKQIREEADDAEGDPMKEKAFCFTTKAMPYQPMDVPKAVNLYEYREGWLLREPPVGVCFLGAALDVQVNRIEIGIIGFSEGPTPRDPQLWIVDYAVIPGAPTEPGTFTAAEEYLNRPIQSASGVELKPAFVAVDMGNWAGEVKSACYHRAGKGWIAIKGSSTLNAPLISPPRRHDFRASGKKIRGGGRHHMIGGNDAKDTLLTRLAALPDQPERERWFHFPRDLPMEFVEHLCSEWKEEKTGRWTPIDKNKPNEGLDITVYAWAVAHLPDRLRIGRLTRQDWDLAREALQGESRDQVAETESESESESEKVEPKSEAKIEPEITQGAGGRSRNAAGSAGRHRAAMGSRRGRPYVNDWR